MVDMDHGQGHTVHRQVEMQYRQVDRDHRPIDMYQIMVAIDSILT